VGHVAQTKKMANVQDVAEVGVHEPGGSCAGPLRVRQGLPVQGQKSVLTEEFLESHLPTPPAPRSQ
jgi:hypothetical protein